MSLENKISVIVPVYNTEEYLERCLNSILMQNYKNFEVLMVNDGSEDNSHKICEKYCNLDPRFVLINQKNGGLSEARNHGIRNATGDFVVLVDSDDYIAHNLLKSGLDLINKYGVDLIISSYYIVKSKQKMNPGFREPSLGIVSSEKAIEELLNGSFGNYSWKIFASREIYLENHIEFPIGRQYEDVATTYKLLASAKSIYISSQKLYFYVQRENSITHMHSDNDLNDIISTFSEMLEFVQKKYPRLVPNVLRFKFNMILMLIIRFKNWENQLTIGFSDSEKEYINSAIYQLHKILKSQYGKSRLFYRQRVKFFALRTNILPLILNLNRLVKQLEKKIK